MTSVTLKTIKNDIEAAFYSSFSIYEEPEWNQFHFLLYALIVYIILTMVGAVYV